VETNKEIALEFARVDLQGSEKQKKKRKGKRRNVDRKKEGMGREESRHSGRGKEGVTMSVIRKGRVGDNYGIWRRVEGFEEKAGKGTRGN